MDRHIIPIVKQKEIVSSLGLSSRTHEGWYLHWLAKRRTSKYRNLDCVLTFKQYVRLAVKAGLTKPSQIGVKPGYYCLSRKGDKGGYSVSNCRFVLVETNLKEIFTNGRMDAAITVSASRRKGQSKFTLDSIAAQATKMSGRTKRTHIGLAVVAHKISKDYVLKSPSGKIHRGRNLKEFCKQYGFSQTSMARLCRGETIIHKGWTGSYV